MILAWPAAPAYIAHARGVVEDAWTTAGRAGGPVIVASSPISIDTDLARARARLRPQVAAELAAPSSRAHLEPLGLVDEVAELIKKCGSPAEFADRVPDEWIDLLAIVGDPTRCAAKIAQLQSAGAQSIVLGLSTPLPDERSGGLIRELVSLLGEGPATAQ